ncbi:MAG: GNAT family N-acetyltransferase [Alphaproteobacteria bacterium]|nr:GNAT family N-acetyltransferase [Alphaproteobacteria bacterium]
MPDFAAPEDEDLVSLALLRARAAAGLLWLAEENAVPVGFACADELDGVLYLAEIDVVPEAAGQGVGAALLRSVEACAIERRLPAVTLATFRDVPWNAPWYARHGYHEWPEARECPGHDAVWRHHEANGLDMTRRLFMRKDVSRPGG